MVLFIPCLYIACLRAYIHFIYYLDLYIPCPCITTIKKIPYPSFQIFHASQIIRICQFDAKLSYHNDFAFQLATIPLEILDKHFRIASQNNEDNLIRFPLFSYIHDKKAKLQ